MGELGTLLDWVTAAAAMVAAIGTVGALFVSIWLIHQERRRREGEQARRVSVWSEWRRTSSGHDSTPRQYYVYIHNASDSPIFVDSMEARQVRKDGRSVSKSLLWGIVPAYAIDDYGLDEAHFDREADPPTVEILFRDVDTVQWFRDSGGNLRRVSSGPTQPN